MICPSGVLDPDPLLSSATSNYSKELGSFFWHLYTVSIHLMTFFSIALPCRNMNITIMRKLTKAKCTLRGIFFSTIGFPSTLRQHFCSAKLRFLKMLSQVNKLKTAVFVLECTLWKKEIFDNNDV